MEEKKVHNESSLVKTASEVVLYGSDGETAMSECESDEAGA